MLEELTRSPVALGGIDLGPFVPAVDLEIDTFASGTLLFWQEFGRLYRRSS